MTDRARSFRTTHQGREDYTSVLPRLQKAADAHVPLTVEGVRQIAAELNIPAAALRGAISSYTEMGTEHHAVKVCAGTSCMLAGGAAVSRHMSEKTRCEPVYCLGYCDRSPAAMSVSGKVLVGLSADNSDQVVGDGHLPHPAPPSVRCEARHAIVSSRLMKPGHFDAAAPTPVYSGLAAALGMSPTQVVDTLLASGAKGRGGAAYPTGRKWQLAAAAKGTPKFVVANGDEGDPGSFVDRELMERDPHSILEGMAICAHAIGATRGVVFIRHEYPIAKQVMEEAIANATKAGYLGADALGLGREFIVEVVRGMGSYVCGEETALLAAIEAERGEVRPRPPFPVEAGLYGRPTVVDNVETLGNVPWIMQHGVAAYTSMGTADSKGTKALCFNKGFAKPGIVEVEFGGTLRDAIERIGGGGAGGDEIVAVLLGGPMGSIVWPEEWDVPICFTAMQRKGINLGHGGLVAIPKSVDWYQLMRHLLSFMRDESCGKCNPCRLGSTRLHELAAKGLSTQNIDEFRSILALMKDASLCAFGRETPGPIEAILKRLGGQVVKEVALMSATNRTVAFIDGLEVDVVKGETILDAANRIGIEIPNLCHSPELVPEGGCRMCMVEIAGQRRQAACHTPLAPGMNICTANEHLEQLRRGILSLTMASAAGPFRPSSSGSKFEQLLARYNVAGKEPPAAPRPIDASHPYMRFDRDRCITCRLCLNACEQVQGQFVYAIAGRGGKTSLIYGPGDEFAQSDCVSCGACIDVCPTGAITDRDRLAAAAPDRAAESVCGYCGVGCRVRVESKDNVVLRIKGVEHAAVNDGHLCVKGRFAHAYHHSSQRLTTPLLRDASGTLKPATWDEAMSFTARRLLELKAKHGPNALGTMTSSRSTNEAAYLLQKLFRTIIGTNNTDCCARVCHSSTAVALGAVTGTGAATASYIDIGRAKVIVIAGANPTEAHPVVGAKLKQAVLEGAKLVVIDPRKVELARYAGVHLQIWPGSNVATFNALAKLMIEEGLFDRAYVESRCEGFDKLKAFLGATPLSDFAAEAKVSEADLRAAARIIASGPALFVSGLGLSEQSQGVASVMTYCNLGLLTGSLGKPGAGMLPLRGQNNVQGNADMGSQPYALTGYYKVDDEAARSHLARIWGTMPPREVGKTIPEMYDAACDGSLKALWIQGEDVAQSDPNHEHVVKALGSLDLLVVQELFMTQTAAMAHVVFPAAAVLEQEGTFTNGERRVQHVRPAANPPGQARPDWEVIRDVAAAMAGSDAGRWHYDHPSKIMEELGVAVPHMFGGITYDRLLDDGVQWPCPDKDHPGTSSMHTKSFVRPGGKALLTCVDYSPPRDAPDAQFPMVLITGRILDHYNVGTMTRRTPSSQLVERDYVELHPADARRLGIADGGKVHVHSRWGQTVAMAKHSGRMQAGTAFMTFHFPETNTNCVVGPIVDPTSKCPDYKVVAVRLSPVAG